MRYVGNFPEYEGNARLRVIGFDAVYDISNSRLDGTLSMTNLTDEPHASQSADSEPVFTAKNDDIKISVGAKKRPPIGTRGPIQEIGNATFTAIEDIGSV